MTLKKKALTGVKWTSLASLVAAVVQLAQVATLTRFLDKEDFGLIAIAIFVLGISQIFTDIGISNSVIHKEEVNDLQLSTLFWLNIIMGALIFTVLYMSGPAISKIYEEPDLTEIIFGISLTFLVMPFGQLYETLLKKELKFKALAIKDISSKTVSLVVSIILATKNFGAFSLVFANLAAVAISTVISVSIGQRLFKPKFSFSIQSIRDQGLLAFGLYQMGEKVINYFNSQFDTLIIGKILGMDSLGIYNIAKTLAFKPYQLINPIITGVSFPVLSRLQNDTQKLKSIYLSILEILSTTNAPIYLIMIIWADPLINVAFGKEWMTAIPVFRLLCISAFCNSIGNPVGALQLAKGKADLGFYWNLGMLIFMPVIIWIGSKWGILSVSLSIAVFKLIILIPAWRLFVYPLCNASAKEYFWSFGKPVLFSVIGATVAGLLVVVLFGNDSMASLIIGTFFTVCCVSAINLKFNKNFIATYAGYFKF
jgi:O-antigen/teichoic acid export membrane protein